MGDRPPTSQVLPAAEISEVRVWPAPSGIIVTAQVIKFRLVFLRLYA